MHYHTTDQFDSAYLLNQLGAGLGFSTQHQQVTAEELGRAISNDGSNLKMINCAKEVGRKMKKTKQP